MRNRPDLNQLKSIIDYMPSFVPKGFLEIGGLNADDSKLISDFYNIDAYVIEPNPFFYNEILLTYPGIKAFNFAFSDVDGECLFNAINSNDLIFSGMSSVLENKSILVPNKIKVQSKRGDTFLKEENISVNFVKIDVEGFAYQVIKGFGDKINLFDAIQVETERQQKWYDQLLDSDVQSLLESKGFELANRIYVGLNQYDSLYIKQGNSSI